MGDGPYAVCTVLGWCVNGPLRGVAASPSDDKLPAVSVDRLQISCLENQVQRYFDMDFSDPHIFSDEKAFCGRPTDPFIDGATNHFASGSLRALLAFEG